MNTCPASRKLSLVSKVLIATLVCLCCLIGSLSYALLGRGQKVQVYASHSTAFQVAQFKADVRTVLGAISYLLEPESEDMAAKPEYVTPADFRTAVRKLS